MTERDGFDTWYEQAWPRLLKTLATLALNRQAAEDVAAEACARAYERWDEVVLMESRDAWLHAVALNLMRSGWRRKRTAAAWLSRQRIAEQTVVVEEADPEVWSAIRSLPARTREVVVLRYVADLTQAEIARTLRVSPGTVASTLSAERRALAAALSTSTEEVGKGV